MPLVPGYQDLLVEISNVEEIPDKMLEIMTGNSYPEDVNHLALLLLKRGLEFWNFRKRVHSLMSSLEFSAESGGNKATNKEIAEKLKDIINFPPTLTYPLNVSDDTMNLLKKYADSLVEATKDNSATGLQHEEARSYAVEVLGSIIFDPANNIGLVRDRLIELRRFESLPIYKQVEEKKHG